MNAIKSQRKKTANARFDARLSSQQKNLFEEAAKIKGYKSLSEFVIQVVQEAALEIVERHHAIVESEDDKRIFFEALINPPLPNKTLSRAAKAYKKRLS